MIVIDSDLIPILSNPTGQEHLACLTDAAPGSPLHNLGNCSVRALFGPPPRGLYHEIVTTDLPERIFEVMAAPLDVTSPETGQANTGIWLLYTREVTRAREQQARLQEHQRLAAVGQLASGIAHDFNNLLSTIMLDSQLVQRTQPRLSEANEERLSLVIQQAQRAGDMIGQLLDFTRQSALERKRLDLVPIIMEQVKLLERMLPTNIKLKLNIEPDKYRARVDPTRIAQMLINLALNARDAMPDGGVLCIGLSKTSEDPAPGTMPAPDAMFREWIRFSVADTGTGISEENLTRIFEPFYTTKPPGRGTGLGLAQVLGIVKQHDGHIDVQSRVGTGTVISIYLPSLPSGNTRPTTGRNEAVVSGSGHMILLVEDDPTVRRTFRDMLETLNYRVLEAPNGGLALEIYAQYQADIDLVLTDHMMPAMTGLDLCRELLNRNPNVCLLLMTGYSSQQLLDELLSLGDIPCISKTMPLVSFSQAVAAALETGQS